MLKSCITLSFCCLAFFAKAQNTASPSIQDAPANNGAINISIPHSALSEADLFFEDASKSEKHGALNDALTAYGKAAFEYSNEKKTSQYATALLKMSNIHLQLANYNEAEQVVLNAVLKAYIKLGSKHGQMLCYAQLGKIYLGASKLTQSMWFFTQQGILAKQMANNGSYIESVIGIANVKIKKKDFKLALKDLSNAESLSKSYKLTQYNQQIKTSRALIERLKG